MLKLGIYMFNELKQIQVKPPSVIMLTFSNYVKRSGE